MEGPRADPELLSRCHRVCVEGYWQTLRGTPGARRHSLGPPGCADLLECDLRFSHSNAVFVRDPGDHPEELLARAAAVFGRRTAWRVVATGDRADELGRAALALGLRANPAQPGLVLDPLPDFGPAPPGLEVRVVATPEELRDWGAVWCTAFRIPRSVFHFLFPRLPTGYAGSGQDGRLEIGYEGSRPVACAASCVTDATVGVFSVGTVPSARGHGYGTALTARAVEEGRTLGATSAFLLASSMGLPVYRRMGFRPGHAYPSWEVPMGRLETLGVLVGLSGLARRARRVR